MRLGSSGLLMVLLPQLRLAWTCCRKQQKEIKPVDDPELEGWLRSQRLPQQRVRTPL